MVKMSVEDVLKEYDANINGLSDDEAKIRLEKYGKNELVEKEKDGPIKLFLKQFADILIVLLIIAAVISYFIGSVVDSIVIFIVVILNSAIGFSQEYRAEKAMEKLKSLVSNEAVVRRNGEKNKIPASELTIGDIVIIDEGDKVPADLRLVDVADLRIDESALTGESLPVTKESQEEKVKEKKDLIAYMDSAVVSGRGLGVVTSIGMDTSIGKIATMIQEDSGDTPLQEKIAKLGKVLGLIALVVCIIVFIIEYFIRGMSLAETFMTAVSLAVASVPEGLPAILTLTLALGMQKMAKSNAIVRKLLAVETLGSCNVICTDKTGTLTHNKMSVRDVDLYSKEKSLEICALCNNSVIKEGKVIGDPTDGAVMAYAQDNNYLRDELVEKYHRIKEIPLDSTRKRMTTIHEKDNETYVFTKGAPELVLNLCNSIEKDGIISKITHEDKEKISSKINEMTSSALRVLSLSYRVLDSNENIDNSEDIEKDLIFVGLVGMMDPPRDEAKEAIAKCKKAGITTVMITGDHQDTAAAIAKELNMLGDGKVITGNQLHEMDDEEFNSIVEDVKVYARVFPEQKVRIVEALQKKGNIVSMTGDGVNDAPALKKASIGVSMGSGTDVAKESAEMILQDDNFATIVSAVKEGRTIFDNIRRFIKFQLSTNVGAILTIVSASLMSLPIPFTPIQILWINIIMDGPPAQSLGIEPPEENIMERGPENEDILSKPSLIKIIIAGIVMAVGTLGLYIYELNSGVSNIKAMTVAFTLFVMFQIFNAFNKKNKKNFSNKIFTIAIGLSFILQLLVVYTPFLQDIFKTTALDIIDWVFILLISATIFISDWLAERYIQ